MQFETIWKVIDRDQTGKIFVENFHNVLQAYEVWTYEKNYRSTMKDIYGNSIPLENPSGQRRSRVINVMDGVSYELCHNVICILNVLLIANRQN